MPNEFIARNGVIALNNSSITGSLGVTGGITGSLFGTSSWAFSSSVAVSSSVTISGSYALTASFVVSSSYALSSSYAISSSLAYTASSVGTLIQGVTITGSLFVSNSIVLTPSGTISVVSGSITALSFTGSYFGTSSWAYSASVAISSSYALSSSFALTSSLALTSSYPFSVGSGVLSSSKDFDSIYIGRLAGFGTTNLAGGIYLGNTAGSGSIGGFSSAIFIGESAGTSVKNVAQNSIFIGISAGVYSDTVSNNVFIGALAGYSASISSHSILLGYQAGARLSGMPTTYGSNNIIIGNNITLSSSRQDSINIGGILFGTGSYGNTSVGVNPYSGSVGNGKIGINVVNPNYNLDVSGSANFTNGLTVTGSVILSGSESYIGVRIVTGSLIVSNSLNVIGKQLISGALFITGGLGANLTSTSLNVIGTQIISGSLIITTAASDSRTVRTGISLLASSKTGTGPITSSAVFLYVSGAMGSLSQSLFVSGHLLPAPWTSGPSTSSRFDLGSSTNPWRRLWVATRSVYFVDEDTGLSGSIGLDPALGFTYNDYPIINSQGAISSSFPFTVNGSTIYSTLDPATGNSATSNNSLFIGAGAGYQATNSDFSNFVGPNAGYLATNAPDSNFIGNAAGSEATNASFSNFIGQSAGAYASEAVYSNFIGDSAGYLAYTASYSNFIGVGAGDRAEFANNANFIGNLAGRSASFAVGSNFLGSSAGFEATNAGYSNFLGVAAGYQATNAQSSNFLGNSSGRFGYNAYYSNFFGNESGYGATNAFYSNFLGYQAGFGAYSSSQSNFFGYKAGYQALSASNSNYIGTEAGLRSTSSSYSTFIGYRAGFSDINSSYYGNDIGKNNIIIGTGVTLEKNRQHSINIAGLIFGTGSYFNPQTDEYSSSYSGSANGKIGINVPNPQYELDVSGSGNYTNGLTVTGSLIAPNITGSLFGTSSWASNAVTASYVTGSVHTSKNPALSASYALSSSYTISSLSSSFSSTASYVNTLNQNVVITGSLTVGTSSIGANENTLVLGPSPAGGIGEGGQLLLQSPNSGGYTSASMLDNYQNLTRLLRGTNAGSDAVVASFNMHTKQVQFPSYNSTTAFTGTTLVGLIGFDSNGNLLTTNTGSGGGGTPVTITNNVDNYIITATGTANTINGESNLQFNGSTLSVTGNVTATSITSSGAFIAQANGAMYFRGGDDAELWDINVANTVGIYGQQNQGIGAIKLGSGGGTLTGLSGSIGIGTITPSNATVLDVVGTSNVSGTFLVTGSARFTGSVSATQGGFTGSLFGTSSWANNVVTAQTASYVNNLNQNLSLTGSVILSGSTGIELTVLGDQHITGSLRVSNGVIAQSVSASLTGSLTGALIGTSSWATNALTASSLAILSQSIVTINASQGFRFPGFNVIDSGSATTSGSLLFDSQNNNWLFVHSQTPSNIITSSLLIMGPETFGNIGNETKLTNNRIPKSQGDEHIADSNIFDDGTNIQITGSNVIISGASTALIVTGSVRSLGGFTGSLFGTSSWASNLVGGSTAFPYAGTATITGSVVQQTGSAFFPTLNASESLAAGDWINISASFVRKASSTDTTKQCHGFVIAAVSSGSAATIYYNGINPANTGLTVGARYFLSASAAESVNAPTITGQLSQEVGVAVSTTAILTNIGPAIIT